MPIYSLEVEKFVVAGLLKYPAVFADIDAVVGEGDFFHPVNRTIFCVIRQNLANGKNIDKVLVGQTIKNMGIIFEDEINIFDYLEALSLIQINQKAVIEACRELKKYTIARDMTETAEEIVKMVKGSLDKPAKEIIAKADTIYNRRISMYQMGEEPVNLFDGIQELVEARGNSPVEELGYRTPYPEFNRMFGGLKNGNIYAFVSRPGHGKTSLLTDCCFKTSNVTNKGVRALMLDTEMETTDIRFRIISSLTGVPCWYLETGNWRKNQEMVTKVRAAWPLVKNYNVDHIYVAGRPIDQIISIIRRWFYSKVGRGNPAIISYDYIKLTGERISNDWKEYQAIGQKIDALKQLSVELSVPILVACQLNRTAEGKDAVDDSSAISQSDRLQWFATFVAIFRRKVIEEIASDGEEFGTHKLIHLKARFQGRDGFGHHDIVRTKDAEGKAKYLNNFINFQVENFNLTEKGTLREIVAQSVKDFKPGDGDKKPDGDLL